jgi:hypothetical protein
LDRSAFSGLLIDNLRLSTLRARPVNSNVGWLLVFDGLHAMNRKRVLLVLAGALLFAVILATVATYLLNRPSERVIAQWQQPASIDYGSSKPFRFIVVERDKDWNDFPYTERTYNIYVGDDFPYGSWYRFPFYYHQREVEREIKESTVEWSTEGVTFKAKSGEVLFVPKRVFAAKAS